MKYVKYITCVHVPTLKISRVPDHATFRDVIRLADAYIALGFIYNMLSRLLVIASYAYMNTYPWEHFLGFSFHYGIHTLVCMQYS